MALVERFERVFAKLKADGVTPDVAAQVALALVTEDTAAETEEQGNASRAGTVPPGAEPT